MNKYLITGSSGFVSQHFLRHLNAIGKPAVVLGLDVNKNSAGNDLPYEFLSCSFIEIDLLDQDQVRRTIETFRPDFILHLASYSSVAFSWKNPMVSFANNTNIFLNVLEQVRTSNLTCRILSVGSSEEYGKVSPDDVPLLETHAVKPLSPYAVARVSQEMLSKIYVDAYGMDIVLTRSFNHIGPGQRDIFVISSFAKQLIEIKQNRRQPEIVTGDLSIIRDFLDVRDVVRAYYLLLHHGQAGEIYNVSSNKGIKLERILEEMIGLVGITITTRKDEALVRPSDNPIIIGNHEKLTKATGWKTEIELRQSLLDVLHYWESVA